MSVATVPQYKDYVTYDLLDRIEPAAPASPLLGGQFGGGRLVAQARLDLDKMIEEGLVCPTGVSAS